MRTILTLLLSALFVSQSLAGDGPARPAMSGAVAETDVIWSAWGGRTTVRFDPGLMKNYRIQIQQMKSAVPAEVEGGIGFQVLPLGSLEIWAPKAAFDGFRSGRLIHDGGLVLATPTGSVSLENFSLRPSADKDLSLDIVNSEGMVVFRADHIHAQIEIDKQVLTLWNMDLRLSREAAMALNYPELEDNYLGQAFSTVSVNIPPNTKLGSCGSPNWHDGVDFLTDVALIEIGSVGQQFRQDGIGVVVAPSATLQNVGTADVPWIRKFNTPAGGTYPEPYGRDQHPFLVWALYRLQNDGIFRQLGVSQAKHAFLTINSLCSCSAGSILWAPDSSPNGVGCADVYGQGTNDSPSSLGPRAEIPAFTGEWEQCGSFFAPGEAAPGPCNATNGSGVPNGEFDRRMVIDEADLVSGSNNHWSEAWYVIRDDVNIFNSMGYRQTTPTQDMSDNWNFSLGTFNNGAAIDAWIPPGTATATERHERLTTEAGHLSMAVEAIDLGGGTTRLVYAIMNFDYDDQIRSVTIPAAGLLASNIQVFTPDGAAWSVNQTPAVLQIDAPAGTGLDWGHMLTLAYEVDTPVDVGTVTMESLESAAIRMVTTLVHVGNLDGVFSDSFE